MAFEPYNPLLPVTKTHRNLPHWQQAAATYFVTFRLADSLPIQVRLRLRELRELNAAEAFEWVDGLLDAGAGNTLLTHSPHRLVVESAMRHFDQTRYSLGEYVIMPNHVHVLIQPFAGYDLTSVLHSWKSYTAHELRAATRESGPVWQKESFDRIVRDEAELHRFTEYVWNNPTKAGLAADQFTVGRGHAEWATGKVV